MDVTCDECGTVSQIMHPVDDGDAEVNGWLYRTETREYMLDSTDPAGNAVQLPALYEHPVARYVVWKCAEPVHGPDGQSNVYEEELD
jgi:hypothetical protein